MRATSPKRRQNIANATFRGVGRSHGTSVAPPELKPGQVRCPVCRNGTRTTVYGFLRKHRDLFGNDCYAKAPAITLPPDFTT